MRYILVTAGLLTFLQACYYDKEAIVYPTNETCDTADVRYSVGVSNLINTKCLTCHGSSVYNSMGGNLNLEGYNNVVTQINNGKLLKVIEHEAGVSPMPKNADKLSDCEILMIKKWIEAEAPNN